MLHDLNIKLLKEEIYYILITIKKIYNKKSNISFLPNEAIYKRVHTMQHHNPNTRHTDYNTEIESMNNYLKKRIYDLDIAYQYKFTYHKHVLKCYCYTYGHVLSNDVIVPKTCVYYGSYKNRHCVDDHLFARHAFLCCLFGAVHNYENDLRVL